MSIEHDLTLILTEQLADFINMYIICCNMGGDTLTSQVNPGKEICFSPSSDTRINYNSRVYIRKNSRTIYYFHFSFSYQEREMYNMLYNIVDGYTELDIRRRASTFNTEIDCGFTLDLGCKKNSQIFFQNIVSPNNQDFGGMIS